MSSWYWVIVALAVGVVAFRIYGAIVAAKAGGESKTCLQRALRDVAISVGAGPFIGPVLALQFGYVPSLIWILAGMALGGVVQDVVTAGLSRLRGGRSISQLARDYAGGLAGNVMIVVLAIGSVVLAGTFIHVIGHSLGGREITYPAGTTFLAPEAGTITAVNRYDNVLVYRVPPGSTIRWADGRTSPVEVQFELHGRPTNQPTALPLDVKEPGKLPGTRIEVFENIRAVRYLPGNGWATLGSLLALPIGLLCAVILLKVKKGGGAVVAVLGTLLLVGAVYFAAAVNDQESWVNYYAAQLNMPAATIMHVVALLALVSVALPAWVYGNGRDVMAGAVLVVVAVVLLVLASGVGQLSDVSVAGTGVSGHWMPFLFVVLAGGVIGGLPSLVVSTPETPRAEGGMGTMLGSLMAVGIVLLLANAPVDEAKPARVGNVRETQMVLAEKLVEGPIDGTVSGAQQTSLAVAKAAEAKRAGAAPYVYHGMLVCLVLAAMATLENVLRAAKNSVQEVAGKSHAAGVVAAVVLVGAAWGLAQMLKFEALWPLFGTVMLLTAAVGLAICAVGVVKERRGSLVWVTMLPLFITATAGVAGVTVLLNRNSPHYSIAGMVIISGFVLLAAIVGVLCFGAARRK